MRSGTNRTVGDLEFRAVVQGWGPYLFESDYGAS